MAQDAFRFTGNDALNYDQYLGPLLFDPSSRQMLAVIDQALARSGNGQPRSILEVSSGSGRLTRPLRLHFPPETALTATDLSPDMLELAELQVRDAAVQYVVADAQHLPFPDASFDLVVNQYGLMFLQDKQRGFQEAFRVLRPGGCFAFATWDYTTRMPLYQLVMEETIIPTFKGEDLTYFYVPFSLHDPEQLKDWLAKAGFSRPEVQLKTFQGHSESARRILTGMYLKHPLGRLVKEKFPDAWERIAREIEEKLTRHFGNGPIEFELKAWFGTGMKD